MGVLLEGNKDQLDSQNTLTTKFVYDWRLKDRVQPDGSSVKAWLRRSRLVAREFAFWEKRSDTYSPATSTHMLNVLPMKYLQSLVDVPNGNTDGVSKVCLGTLDVKDAFLMVDQPSPMVVTLLGRSTQFARTSLDNVWGPKVGTGTYVTSCPKRWLFSGVPSSRAWQITQAAVSWYMLTTSCIAETDSTGSKFFFQSLPRFTKSAMEN